MQNSSKQIDSTALSIVLGYFPELSPRQVSLFAQLAALYEDWNGKINLISRQDISNLYVHHVLHALSIARFTVFTEYTHILDVGTGGGFPGVPLAIMFPSVTFHLVDSIGKKIKAVEAIVSALGVNNVALTCSRAEDVQGMYDFVVGRGVADLEIFCSWVGNKIKKKSKNSIQNGILYLKGKEGATPASYTIENHPLSRWFKEDFFKEKYLIYAYKQKG